MKTLDLIVKLVKTDENYVPRNHKTIGGMWTVDTWQKDNIVVRLLDEGYTTTVSAPDLYVVDSGGSITFGAGNWETVKSVYRTLIKSQSKE